MNKVILAIAFLITYSLAIYGGYILYLQSYEPLEERVTAASYSNGVTCFQDVYDPASLSCVYVPQEAR